MQKTQYGVWEEEKDASDGGYWILFSQLPDLIEHCPGAEIYQFEPKRLGYFSLEKKFIKVKKGKK